MLPELSARLSQVIEQKRLKEKLVRDISAVEAELEEQSSRLARLGAQLETEKVDVEKLERKAQKKQADLLERRTQLIERS